MQKCSGLSHFAALATLVSIIGCTTLAAPSDNQESSPLKQVADLPLPGRAVRFDYQSLDASHGRLYIAYAPGAKRVFVSDEHGNADAVIDATTNSLIATIPLDGGAGNLSMILGPATSLLRSMKRTNS